MTLFSPRNTEPPSETASRMSLQGLPHISCELIGTPGSVPRTRHMTLSDGTVAEETIVYQKRRDPMLLYVTHLHT